MSGRGAVGSVDLLSLGFLSLVFAVAPQAPAKKDGAKESKPAPEPTTYVVKAKRIHLSPGNVIEDGAILVENGKITSVGNSVGSPSGAVTLEAAEVTAGLIDANDSAGQRELGAEDSSEITPNFRAIANLDTDSSVFGRLAKSGVTTVFVAPSNRNVVGGIASVSKTFPLESPRVVVADSALKIAFGDEPIFGNFTPRGTGLPQNFHVRRPGSRPGVVMEARVALDKARRNVGKMGIVPPDMKPLVDVFEANFPVRLHAYYLVDLRSALRVAKEFGLKNLTIDGALEAHRCLPELKAAGAKLVIGPNCVDPTGGRDGRGRAIDYGDVSPAMDLLARVEAAGIPVALSANGARPDDDLVSQMRTAVRYGASKNTALKAVTTGPAEILGIADRAGSIAAGRDADLVLWSGDPFELTSRITNVLVDGHAVSPRAH